MDKILETPFTITRSSIMPPKNADLFRLNKNLIIYWAVVLEYIRLYRCSIFEVCRYRCEAERELYRRGKWGQGVALSHIDLNSCKHQWEEMRQFLIIGQSHLVFITYNTTISLQCWNFTMFLECSHGTWNTCYKNLDQWQIFRQPVSRLKQNKKCAEHNGHLIVSM